jgi:hypothetical protein
MGSIISTSILYAKYIIYEHSILGGAGGLQPLNKSNALPSFLKR